jgi:hypothetical protein
MHLVVREAGLTVGIDEHLHVKHREQKRSVLKMAFKGFLNAFLRLPCQIVRTGRRIVVRLLSWNPWLEVLLRGVDALRAMSGSRAAPRGSSPFRPLRC